MLERNGRTYSLAPVKLKCKLYNYASLPDKNIQPLAAAPPPPSSSLNPRKSQFTRFLFLFDHVVGNPAEIPSWLTFNRAQLIADHLLRHERCHDYCLSLVICFGKSCAAISNLKRDTIHQIIKINDLKWKLRLFLYHHDSCCSPHNQ